MVGPAHGDQPAMTGPRIMDLALEAIVIEIMAGHISVMRPNSPFKE